MKLPFNLDSIVNNVSSVKLRGGMVGKVCHVLIFVAVSMALISWSARSMWIAGTGMVLLFVLCMVVLWRLISLGHKNPNVALMDGTELLLHEQLVIASKGGPVIVVQVGEGSQAGPLTISDKDHPQLMVPDIAQSVEGVDTGTEQKGGKDNV